MTEIKFGYDTTRDQWRSLVRLLAYSGRSEIIPDGCKSNLILAIGSDCFVLDQHHYTVTFRAIDSIPAYVEVFVDRETLWPDLTERPEQP